MSEEQARAALTVIWGRMARPLNTAPAVAALLGLPNSVIRQFLGATIASSAAAEALLDAMPKLVRSLSIATVTTSQRCVGEIRGPVQWSETMSARSATAGDPGLFICSAPARAYDTPDNEVLVGALDAIARAGADVDRVSSTRYDDPILRRARHNTARANRFLEHRSLASIPRGRPSRRAIQRARAGRRPTFAPSIAVLQRADEPVDVDNLLPFCDERTVAQHDLLVATIRAVERRGEKLPAFHVERGVLRSGPLSYRHEQLRDEHDAVSGVRVGDVLFDVPQGPVTDIEAARARFAESVPDGLDGQLVLGRNDLSAGIDRALRARRPTDRSSSPS